MGFAPTNDPEKVSQQCRRRTGA